MKKTFVVPTLRKEADLAVLTLQVCPSGQTCD